MKEANHVEGRINKFIPCDGSKDGIFRFLDGNYYDYRCNLLRNYSNHSYENTISGLGYHPNPNFHPSDGLHP